MRPLNDSNTDMEDSPVTPETFAKLVDMVNDNAVSGNAGKVVLRELFEHGGDPGQIVKDKNLAQVSDTGFIQETVDKILNDNPKEVEQYHAGKETLFQWFMGQVARSTKGKADPNVAKELMAKGLEERKK